jgi:hypothetical protein
MKADRMVLGAVLGICGVYALAFFLPVYDIGGPRYGWEIFLDCLRDIWAGESVFESAEMFSANPLLWVGAICLCVRRPHLALAAGIAASVAAARAVYHLEDFASVGFRQVNLRDIASERCGAYLWLASMILLACAGLAFTIRQWRQTRRLPMLGEAE